MADWELVSCLLAKMVILLWIRLVHRQNLEYPTFEA